MPPCFIGTASDQVRAPLETDYNTLSSLRVLVERRGVAVPVDSAQADARVVAVTLPTNTAGLVRPAVLVAVSLAP